jgi:hypothetical protein
LDGECSSIKADGTRCRGIAIRGSAYCPAHDPATQERRRRGASKGGRATKGSSGRQELAEIRTFLQGALTQMWRPWDPEEAKEKGVPPRTLDRGDAAVVTQLCNVRLRLVETERKLIETEELAARLERIEQHLEQRRRFYG